jgi:hypothetical protein
LADYDPETFLKTLVGKRGVEDVLLRLDSLTKEESLMAVARNLEATHAVDRIVRGVDSNVKAAKEGMHYFLSMSEFLLTLFLTIAPQNRNP